MNHLVLMGDSIFDNARYVPNEQPVIEQMRGCLPKDWSASLLAVDGSITAEVRLQVGGIPDAASHVVISSGGNDALRVIDMLSEKAYSVMDVLSRFTRIRYAFEREYRGMLEAVLRRCPRTAICTVYDNVPRMEPEALTALSMFNEIILREAFAAKVPVIDLRLICTDQADYSAVSPIEPSHQGGQKITAVIARMLGTHDFGTQRSAVYS